MYIMNSKPTDLDNYINLMLCSTLSLVIIKLNSAAHDLRTISFGPEVESWLNDKSTKS